MKGISIVDEIIIHFDQGLRTLVGTTLPPGRPNPAEGLEDLPLSRSERRRSEGLMRVNHAGEVAAQALYHGQALTAHRKEVQEVLKEGAREEYDHLLWCHQRLTELGARPSYLNPLWYLGSMGIGMLAGAAGDRRSLGFVAETERQVVAHLDRHLARLPSQDARSRSILRQMREDEEHHATTALRKGATELPTPVKHLMGAIAKVMTHTAYWI